MCIFKSNVHKHDLLHCNCLLFCLIGLCTLTEVEQKLVYAHVVGRRCVRRGTESANRSTASAHSGKDVFCWMRPPIMRVPAKVWIWIKQMAHHNLAVSNIQTKIAFPEENAKCSHFRQACRLWLGVNDSLSLSILFSVRCVIKSRINKYV